jgi:nicotinate-nucleotide adenylyltransferase
MRLLVLGGSFNPVHLGHLMLAEEVAAEFNYDDIVLVPSFLPPHKTLQGDPGPQHRLEMVRAAVRDDERYSVDDCEMLRGGPSFTIETLHHIAAKYKPTGQPGLVIGDDLAAGFASWRDPDGICSVANLIVAVRGGQYSLQFPHLKAHNMLIPISSTDIRARIAAGKPWRRLVPPGAVEYIQAHGLYKKSN